jgi:hypothetical protein
MESVLKHENNRLEQVLVSQGIVWMVGVNIYPKENDLPLLFASTKFVPWVFGWRGKCGCG